MMTNNVIAMIRLPLLCLPVLLKRTSDFLSPVSRYGILTWFSQDEPYA